MGLSCGPSCLLFVCLGQVCSISSLSCSREVPPPSENNKNPILSIVEKAGPVTEPSGRLGHGSSGWTAGSTGSSTCGKPLFARCIPFKHNICIALLASKVCDIPKDPRSNPTHTTLSAIFPCWATNCWFGP